MARNESEDEPELKARERPSTGTWEVPHYDGKEPVEVDRYFRVEKTPSGTTRTYVPWNLLVGEVSDKNWERKILQP